MSELTAAQFEALDEIRSGWIYTGQFPDEDVAALVAGGLARKVWTGAAGFMGLSQLHVTEKGRITDPQ